MKTLISFSQKVHYFKKYVKHHEVCEYCHKDDNGDYYIFCRHNRCFKCCIQEDCNNYDIFLTFDEMNKIKSKFPEFFI